VATSTARAQQQVTHTLLANVMKYDYIMSKLFLAAQLDGTYQVMPSS